MVTRRPPLSERNPPSPPEGTPHGILGDAYPDHHRYLHFVTDIWDPC